MHMSCNSFACACANNEYDIWVIHSYEYTSEALVHVSLFNSAYIQSSIICSDFLRLKQKKYMCKYSFNPIPPQCFVLKMSSTCDVCCIYSRAIRILTIRALVTLIPGGSLICVHIVHARIQKVLSEGVQL